LIPSGALDFKTRLVLTNAIYFKAAWASPFDPARTYPNSFHLLDGKTIQTPMMHDIQDARYGDHASFSMVELRYENNEQSMIILLPKKKDRLRELEKLLTAVKLTEWLNNLALTKSI